VCVVSAALAWLNIKPFVLMILSYVNMDRLNSQLVDVSLSCSFCVDSIIVHLSLVSCHSVNLNQINEIFLIMQFYIFRLIL